MTPRIAETAITTKVRLRVVSRSGQFTFLISDQVSRLNCRTPSKRSVLTSVLPFGCSASARAFRRPPGAIGGGGSARPRATLNRSRSISFFLGCAAVCAASIAGLRRASERSFRASLTTAAVGVDPLPLVGGDAATASFVTTSGASRGRYVTVVPGDRSRGTVVPSDRSRVTAVADDLTGDEV